MEKEITANSFIFSFKIFCKAILGYIAYYTFFPPILTNYIQKLRGVKFENINSNYIAFNVLLDSNYPELIQIKEGAWLTRGVVILTHFNPTPILRNKIGGIKKGEVIIGRGAFIGVNSIILPNITIGECAIIGAGSVVTKDIPPFQIYAGNPAKFIKKINI